MEIFNYLKPGDVVTRVLAGMPMPVLVGEIKDGYVHCGTTADDPSPFTVPATGECAWRFRVDNGAEYDPDLGWDGITKTGSYLVHAWDEK